MRNPIKRQLFNGGTDKNGTVDFIKLFSNEVKSDRAMPEILLLTSYPPRECGIATYSKDLITALQNKFANSFLIKVGALESDSEVHDYSEMPEVKYILNTDCAPAFSLLAESIAKDPSIAMLLIQHEFGFYRANPEAFIQLLKSMTIPVLIAFHTILPAPDDLLKAAIQEMVYWSSGVVVMTQTSSKILVNEYGIDAQLINIIPHGTHLVKHMDKDLLKETHHFSGRRIISTFGLLSSGKNIETTLAALPAIVKNHQDILFLIIGKTHPVVFKNEGEKYRESLEEKVKQLHLQAHVLFINAFLPLAELLCYLQLTDIYVFTSKDPNQAVSGTFAYALSCGCPIISTPIPHAREVLAKDAGIIIDFESPLQLSIALNRLLDNEPLRNSMGSNGLHRMAATGWENSAISHALLIQKTSMGNISLKYAIPPTNLAHIEKLTTNFGMLQFSKIDQPAIDSGYTLDDNARALIAICQHFELTKNQEDIGLMHIYLHFIDFCQQPQGNFLNYVSYEKKFTKQNSETNLEDANGRAIWALGYLISLSAILPKALVDVAEAILMEALYSINDVHSTRAMAFSIKGLYYAYVGKNSILGTYLISKLANRLIQMYRHESENQWEWFESYLTYANSILPEALLCAWLVTDEIAYKEVAHEAFGFLLRNIFIGDQIKVISNNGWKQKENQHVLKTSGGEQPIDVAYTIMALAKFYEVYQDDNYLRNMQVAFQWFLGNNHLQQIIYNPCTGGCYDGLEEYNVNLNQGAESTISYLMAKLTVEKYAEKASVINHDIINNHRIIAQTQIA